MQRCESFENSPKERTALCGQGAKPPVTREELARISYFRQSLEELLGWLAELKAAEQGADRIDGTSCEAGVDAEIEEMRGMLEGGLERYWRELNRLSEWLAGIDDPLLRRIMTLRYVKRLKWMQVAKQVGGGNTADSVRMAHNRYFARRG